MLVRAILPEQEVILVATHLRLELSQQVEELVVTTLEMTLE
jgi:hypothetical protein